MSSPARITTATDLEVRNPLYHEWREVFGHDAVYDSRVRFEEEIRTGSYRRSPSIEESIRPHQARIRCVSRYSWAVPSPEIIEAIVRIDSPIVEVGAGTGYWAKMLRDAGVDVVAFDQHPPEPDLAANHWHKNTTQWSEVIRSDATVAGDFPDRTLLLVWPPYDEDMATRALRAYAGAGGRQLIYVGEGPGGCTGDDAFHEDLERWWVELAYMAVPQWFGIHDYATFYAHQPPLELVADSQ
jgi:hypothetical protein